MGGGRNSRPRVSVVIPTYNRAALLAEAIASVLSQGFSGTELIVVDDGSTDETGALLASFGDRVTVIRQEHRGVSGARNRGIEAAGADLVAFLDSDDYWLAGKLAAQAAFFEAHPGALVCQTEEVWIRNGRRVNPRLRHRKEGGMIFERSLELCLVSPSAVMVRKALFDRVGRFDEVLPACEDYDLWLRVTCRFPVHLIDRPLIVKRGGHSDQLSRSPGLDRYRIRSIAGILDSGLLDDAQRQAAARVLRKKCRIYAAGCRKRGRSGEAADILSLAEPYPP